MKKVCSIEIPSHCLEEFVLNRDMAGCSKFMSNIVVDLETKFLIIQEKLVFRWALHI